jgi:Flp pilus assembly protein TadG
MTSPAQILRRGPKQPTCCWRGRLMADAGSQIFEFAVSLPLLVVFIVGIFDFGSAFTLKLKLNNAASEAARIGANQPPTDLSTSGSCGVAPPSVCALRDAVDSVLVANKVNDCGLASVLGAAAGTLAWTFTANTGCPGTLTLTVERGFTYTATLATPFPTAPAYTIEATRVTLKYPYKWQFNTVIGLLVSGASYPVNSVFTCVSVAPNLN